MTAEVRNEAQDRLLMLTCRVRETATTLREQLDQLSKEIAAAGTVSDPAARATALQQAGARFHAALATRELSEQRKALKQLLEEEPELCDYANDAWAVADGLPELANQWPPIGSPPNQARMVAGIQASSTSLDELIFHCSMVTIPTEVARQLKSIRVGKPLDFHASFAPLLADAEKRKQLLIKLKYTRICGWVDTASGFIYRLPRTTWGRFLSSLAPFAVAALVGAGLYGFGSLDLWAELDDLGNGGELLGTYGLVLAGAFLHLAIENLKQEKALSPSILSASDGLYWFSLRWVSLVITIFWILVVTIGLRAFGLDPDGEELSLYFFAGYSLDSVLGLLITRIGNGANAAVANLEGALGAPQADPPGAGAPAAAPAPA
ncbi:MAG TPA: hypothetical protein VGB06_00270 [Solirubrobacterales bacterium]|jgi:hypothetical protein